MQQKKLFDHLVGKREQIIGYVQPKRLCRLQVNKQLELGRPQHRQVLGLFTLEKCGQRNCRLGGAFPLDLFHN
jgi:hypothetical protein